MSTTADQELAELRRAYAELQKGHDSALAELQTRTRRWRSETASIVTGSNSNPHPRCAEGHIGLTGQST
jgi:hypothetical protein